LLLLSWQEYLLKALDQEVRKLDNQLRFLDEIARGKLVISNYTDSSLLTKLANRGYARLVSENQQAASNSDRPKDSGYNFLLELPVRTLTIDGVRSSPSIHCADVVSRP
jgi:hypothetical protein